MTRHNLGSGREFCSLCLTQRKSESRIDCGLKLFDDKNFGDHAGSPETRLIAAPGEWTGTATFTTRAVMHLRKEPWVCLYTLQMITVRTTSTASRRESSNATSYY
jgi:hypothetical protein